MIVFRKIVFIFVIFAGSINATETKIIELHKNKSLDQLVLDSENESTTNQENENLLIEDTNIEENQEEVIIIDDTNNIDTTNTNNEDSQNTNNEIIKIENEQTIFDLDKNIFNQHLESITNIKSKTVYNEFIKILSVSEIKDIENNNEKIYHIIKKLYEMGEIGKSYNLIKSLDKKSILNEKYLNYFYLIELNYLFSTFKLDEVCELTKFLSEESINLPFYLLEKSDIFCLSLEKKYSEAKLLNSLLLETEKTTDKNFQKLINYMTLNSSNDDKFQTLTKIESKNLIFLYSAMLRINELPLGKDFIDIDPKNLSIPVILSNSTKMDIRIKAANRAFYSDSLSIDSISALYQSVDFNSSQFSNPKETIISLKNNNELKMAFYFQLANMQIFPDERLKIILDYWNFAKKLGLEKIAYAITDNIIKTITPTSENIKYAMEITFAHISNENYEEALKWINLYEETNTADERVEYAKFLIDLKEIDSLETIINYLTVNYNDLMNSENKKTHETIDILVSFFESETNTQSNYKYYNLIDERKMPSYFLIKDINYNVEIKNDLEVFILSLISISNLSWTELHPEHLILVLNAYNLYDQGLLIKPIILEILNELEIL